MKTRKGRKLTDLYETGPEDKCWKWLGKKNTKGYGIYRKRNAHRAVYEHLIGEVPDGLELDHLCRNPICVNPHHMEPVTHAENVRRGLNGYGARQLCRNGLHDITTPESWYVNKRGDRTCKECHRASWRRNTARYQAKKRAENGAAA